MDARTEFLHVDSVDTDVRITRGFVNTSKGQVHYRVAGEGKPLFLLHPSPFSSRRFIPLLPAMGRHRKVYAFDTPGYGESFRPDTQPSIFDYADTVAELIDGLGYDQVPFYGDLTGAIIAIATAARYPDKVSALALGVIPYFGGQLDEIGPWRARVYPVGFQMKPVSDDGSHLKGLYTRIKEAGLHATGPNSVPADRLTDWVLERMEMREKAVYGFEATFTSDLDDAMRSLKLPILMAQTESHANDAQIARARSLIPNFEVERGPSSFEIEQVRDFLADAIPKFLARHGL